jgi:hypothetical protein
MKVLAIGLMMWMQANCSVPGVNPEHNFCDLNWDHPVPKIVLLPHKELVKEFLKGNGSLAGRSNTLLKAFYNLDTKIIFLEDGRNYNSPMPHSGLAHELLHYVQDMNGLHDRYCIAEMEISTYLMQLHVYRRRFGLNASVTNIINNYKKDRCVTLY